MTKQCERCFTDVVVRFAHDGATRDQAGRKFYRRLTEKSGCRASIQASPATGSFSEPVSASTSTPRAASTVTI